MELANDIFSTKKKESVERLEAFFEDEDVVKALCENNEFAFLVVVMNIYNAETEAKIIDNVFNWTDDFKFVIDIIRQVKFLLWEIEFLDVKQSATLLLKYISDVGISMVALEYLIHISSCDKAKVVNVINSLL